MNDRDVNKEIIQCIIGGIVIVGITIGAIADYTFLMAIPVMFFPISSVINEIRSKDINEKKEGFHSINLLVLNAVIATILINYQPMLVPASGNQDFVLFMFPVALYTLLVVLIIDTVITAIKSNKTANEGFEEKIGDIAVIAMDSMVRTQKNAGPIVIAIFFIMMPPIL